MKNPTKKFVAASVLTTLSGAAIYVLNQLISTAATLQGLLSGEEGFRYDWQFGSIYYTKKGSGTPLLLIHDLTCASSGEEWKYVTDALAANHTVYTIDLLGCGRSDKPKITYTNYLYVQLITGFIKKMIGTPTDVIASGLSGSFVITACSNSPEYFRKIMLINPTDLAKLNQIPGKRSKCKKWMLELPLLGTLLYYMINRRSGMELTFTEQYYQNPAHIHKEDIDLYYESAHRGKGEGKYLLSSLVGNYVNLNIVHALKNVNNSIFLVGGEAEEKIEETFALYTSLNTAIETELLPNTRHLPHMETPDAVLESVRIFF